MKNLILALFFLSLATGCAKAPEERGNKRILVLGDSLTAAYGLDPAQGYPAVLEQMIRDKGFPEVTVTADGVNGATSEGGLERLRAQLGPGDAPRRYDILILELGSNDLLKGLDLDSAKKNLEAVIREAQGRGLQVVLAGMKMPVLQGLDPNGRFRNLFPELAKETHAALIPFLLEGVMDKPSLNLDEAHPNAQGYVLVAETVFKYLEPLL